MYNNKWGKSGKKENWVTRTCS